jgi:NAD(P)-dependent dehydrogenase (short-subunit alcohol dehydrogenase family)
MPSMAGRTWFITGTSRGFGREWASAALARGDRVVATARDPGVLDDLAQAHPDTLLALALDVTERPAVFETVARAHEHFGALDIVVNNAGYGQFGMVEELSERDARDQIETNLFGALWVTQAALPFLRARGAGTSCRSRRSAASRPLPGSAPTTRRSGGSRGSARRWPRRCAASASMSR